MVVHLARATRATPPLDGLLNVISNFGRKFLASSSGFLPYDDWLKFLGLMMETSELEPEIYYARHVHGWDLDKDFDGDFIEYLFRNKIVAIHFNDIASWCVEDYKDGGGTSGSRKKGASSIEYMLRCNGDDDSSNDFPKRYIFASYKTKEGKYKVLAGQPKRNSKCFFRDYLERLADDSLRKRIHQFFKSESNKYPNLKMIFLEDCAKEVDLNVFPHVHLLAPKQSTFVRWHQCRKLALNYLEGYPLDSSDPDSFLPTALEVACEEYLRQKGLLEMKLMASGGTLKDFDIVGIDKDGHQVVAQVKHTTKNNKINSFAIAASDYGAKSSYFFSKAPQEHADGVIWIDLAEVFEYFGRTHKQYLDHLMRATTHLDHNELT